ncbi:MAG: SCP2 sterol-binding domain-containing protein [Zhengella sp.]|uniref:SCP2 sterol-binding domain-containing protein n=1 Tax=Zhengella sp. TaxID=2282762 RepID=UPI001DAA0966|nr:SCP2 sterol-binding domain-containing protein [Notoacmeibacter sp.]MCC0027624.1 SCP2 sterol-binding domain-containing protein [Brucellaceae bacterium]
MTMEEIAAQMREKAADTTLSSSVKFDCGADGVILIDGNTVTTTDGDADCTIKMSKSDFEDMLAGELDPTAAFMQGKITVEGDMSVAMQLSSLL